MVIKENASLSGNGMMAPNPVIETESGARITVPCSYEQLEKMNSCGKENNHVES